MNREENNVMIFLSPGNIIFAHYSRVSEFLKGMWKLPPLTLKEQEDVGIRLLRNQASGSGRLLSYLVLLLC